MNTLQIQPVTVWTPTGTKTATQFSVRYVSYYNGPAIANCRLLDANNEEVSTMPVNATEQQTLLWNGDDDIPFYTVLAQNAGLTVI